MLNTADDVDEILSLATDSRRRRVLYCLLSNERTDIDSLALQIAAWERDETLASIDQEAIEAVTIALHHNHLPKLADSGVVEYDARAGDVVRGDGFHDVEPVVDQLRATEDALGRTESSDSAASTEGPEPFPSA